jgi:hypothetical protein
MSEKQFGSFNKFPILKIDKNSWTFSKSLKTRGCLPFAYSQGLS